MHTPPRRNDEDAPDKSAASRRRSRRTASLAVSSAMSNHEAHVQRSVSGGPLDGQSLEYHQNVYRIFEPPSYELLGEYWH
jgi:hypothetical protein